MADKSFSTERPIKKFSTDEIQNAISDALSKLTGKSYKTEIKNMNYEPNKTPAFQDAVDMQLTITKEIEWDE